MIASVVARLVLAVLGGVAVVVTPEAVAQTGAEAGAPSLPVFEPYPSDWTPDYTPFPYNLWQVRVTPEQIAAERDACQWFNAQYELLMSQVFGFQDFLGDRDDDWAAAGVQPAATTVVANLDQSAAFLDPRAHTLFITNYPDQSQYSPLFHGDSIYRLWFQFTQISDKITRRLPSGQINANVATANVYGTAIRDSGVCDGA